MTHAQLIIKNLRELNPKLVEQIYEELKKEKEEKRNEGAA